MGPGEIKRQWEVANKWEADWHGNCVNSYNEETKQYIYASLIGLDEYKTNSYGQVGWDFRGQQIMDLGCGPYSILLKSEAGYKLGVDPCPYPNWVHERYSAADVNILQVPGEVIHSLRIFDEVLIYNCLQHVIDPEKIIKNALKFGKLIRIFEWIEQGTSDGHIHNLHANDLNKWLGGIGKVAQLSQNPCIGLAYYGIFKGEHYA